MMKHTLNTTNRRWWATVACVVAAVTSLEAGGRPRRWLARETPVGERVAVEGGVVEGIRKGGVLAFYGVPFAAPPAGDQRWAPPRPVLSWTGIRPAREFGPPCPQLDDRGVVVGHEDCLHLNLWTPAGSTTGSRLPVLFFIHGGGHVQGSASAQLADGTYLYDGARLAQAVQAVVVTAQYRLGALGFLAHPALDSASPWGTSGNYGTLDLMAALAWVQRHARAFGGDPQRVLLFGESAGGVQTCLLLVSPGATGLFSAAAIQSGGCGAKTVVQARALAAEFAARAGCAGAGDVAACLRALPVTTVLTVLPGEVSLLAPARSYYPHVDGVVIPAPPLDLLATGRHHRVPLVVGANRDETSPATAHIRTEAQYRAAVLALAGGAVTLAERILAAYPLTDYDSPRQAFTALTSDANFICPARRVARAAVAGQREPVYRYFFTHPWDNASPAMRALGAFHGIELFYVFGTLDALGYHPSAGEVELARFIGASWRELAATGNPTPTGGPAWPRSHPATDPYLELATPPTAREGVRTAQCDFWDSWTP